MQLRGAPDRLQENSIYLHTIYQLSSIDGLILRHRLPAVHLPVSVMSHCCMELYKAPLSSVTSFCRLGVSRGAFQLPRLFPRSGHFQRRLPPLFACSIRKQDQFVDQDRCSITSMFSFTIFHSASCSLSQWGCWWKQSVPWGLRT